MHSDITIIGGGLTGLTLAYLLQREGKDFQILEARKRLGGRVFTKMSGNHIPIDLGGAWFWDYNPRLKGLMKELKISSYAQEIGSKVWYQPHQSADFKIMEIPPQQQTSYRIHGGGTNLILSIAAHLEEESLRLDTVVDKILYKDQAYRIKASNGIFTSNKVILTAPPAVIAASIEFEPALPADFTNTARETQTWMEDSIKFGLGFPAPFWKEKQIPVTAFSNSGPITELYDYSNAEQDRFAIMGFLHPDMNKSTATERKSAVLQQLERLFGTLIQDHVSYEECAWKNEAFTNSLPEIELAPHQNNGNKILRGNFHDQSLFIAGSETSAVLPGYLEGAINSAYHTFNLLMQKS